ncbi:MAG: hypothetical protein PHU83_01490 [Eubacteriales bacterium]|nr:hypothetical protein [Eubacteriales bacterium]
MSKRLYVKDRRFFGRNIAGSASDRPVKKRILIISLIITFIIVSVFIADNVIERKIRSKLDDFDSACEAGHFKSAMSIYRQFKESILDAGELKIKYRTRNEVLSLIEIRITDKINDSFNNVAFDGDVLTVSQIEMLEAFSEITLREINARYFRFLESCVRGDFTEERARLVSKEFMKVSSVKDSIERYSDDISDVFSYQERFEKIEKLYLSKEHIKTLDAISVDEASKSGFLKDFLIKYLNGIKEPIYNESIIEIDVMMSRGKYYSAKSHIEEIKKFFPDDDQLARKLELCKPYANTNLTEYTKPVDHIAVRPLISDGTFMFGRDEYASTAEDLMLTVEEFSTILGSLYQRDYILIDIEKLVDSDGNYVPVMIPEGKKPLIISVEGLNYYASRRFSGNSFNLKIDPSGYVVSEYYDAHGRTKSDRDGEVIGILEQFIEKHPDFSFDGAKGNISLTGFECIFGYVTDRDQVDDRNKGMTDHGFGSFSISDDQIEINRKATADIISRLKETGWTFSSSTYGNISVGESALEIVKSDNYKWQAQVGELIGECKVILFPNGSVVSSKDARGAYLISEGFLIHCGIGPVAYFNHGEHHLFMDRTIINGSTMRNNDLSRFIDVESVYSPARSKKLN